MPKWLIFGFLSIIAANLIINLFFYPSLQKYHSGKAIAEQVRAMRIPSNSLFLLDVHSSNMDFHMRSTSAEVNALKIKRLESYGKSLYIISSEAGKKSMEDSNINFEVLKSFDHYNTQILTLKFLNPSTRDQVFQKRYLLSVGRISPVISRSEATRNLPNHRFDKYFRYSISINPGSESTPIFFSIGS